MEKSSRYERRPTIAIAGAGIGGLTAAIALTRRGFDVEVFERAEAIRATGAGITVQANAMRVMQRLGVAGAIRRAGETFASGAIYDERGRVIQSMDLGAVLDRLGATSVALHRQRLIEILYEACEVPVRVGRAVTGFEQDELGVRVCFDDGDAARFDVLVGCDGLHSTIRRALFGDESLRYAGYTTWRGIWEVDDEATYRAIGEARGEYWGRGRGSGSCRSEEPRSTGSPSRTRPPAEPMRPMCAPPCSPHSATGPRRSPRSWPRRPPTRSCAPTSTIARLARAGVAGASRCSATPPTR